MQNDSRSAAGVSPRPTPPLLRAHVDATRPVPRAIVSLAPALVMLVVGLACWDAFARLSLSRELVAESRDLVDATQQVLADLLEAETGQRGFLLTGDDAYLAPYYGGVERLRADTSRLRALVAGVPGREADVRELHRLAARRVAVLDSVIGIRVGLGATAAGGVIRTGIGKALMDSVGVLIGRVEAAERDRLAARMVLEDARAERVRLVLLLGFAFTAAFSLVVNGVLARFSARQREDARMLAEQNALLAEQATELELQTQTLQEQQAELEMQNEEIQAQASEATESRDELGRRTALLDAVLAGAGAVIAAKDRDGRYLVANDETTRVLGRSEAAILGRTDAELLPATVAEPLTAADRAVMARRTPVTVEEVIPVDGEPRIFSSLKAPLIDEAGEVVGVVVISRDVTHDRVAERRERAQRHLATQLSGLVSPLEVADVAAREVAAAVGAETGLAALCVSEGSELEVVAASGYPPEAASAWARLPIDAPMPLTEAARFGATVWLHSPDERAVRYPALHAREATILPEAQAWAALPLVLSEGAVVGAMSFGFARADALDAATEEHLEELVRRTAQVLERAMLYRDVQAANDAKAGFLATMSHELRTPMNAIIGYAELLLMGVPEPVPEASRSQVTRIRAAARHLLGLVEEILTYSRIEAGREELRAERVNVDELLGEVASVIEPLAQAKGLAFSVGAPDRPIEAGPLYAETDPGKLRQILINLLGNAVKFTDRGRVSLDAAVDKGELTFTVADTGIGLHPDDQARVFEPFWQVQQAKANRPAGTGLGLSVTRRLARLLGGDVTLDSAPGRGTTFQVRVAARTELAIPSLPAPGASVRRHTPAP